MILETKARYFGPADSVQVAIALQEDDYTSAAPKLREGTVEILHQNAALFTETFTAEHRVLWFDGDTNYDTAEDRGLFYFFLHHPPVQQLMSVRVTVTLGDGRTATQQVGIDVDSDDADWQNPVLSGRDPTAYEKDPEGIPYRDV